MKFANKIFGDKLRLFIEKADLTQKDLADATDVSGPTVYGWLTGAFLPGDDKFELICKKLDKQPEEFFGHPPKLDFSSAADLLSKFSNAPPDIQKLVLAVVSRKVTPLETASKEFQRKSIAFLKGVLAL